MRNEVSIKHTREIIVGEGEDWTRKAASFSEQVAVSLLNGPAAVGIEV